MADTPPRFSLERGRGGKVIALLDFARVTFKSRVQGMIRESLEGAAWMAVFDFDANQGTQADRPKMG
ncbi:hypothetical protein BH09VER1_BH09VER1_53580 [soil metagenome]